MAHKHASQHVPNINERKNTDADLYHLASIVESSDDAILSKTLEGVITSWNSGAENLFGYTASEIIGKSISILIPPDRQEELPEIVERIRMGEIVKRYETVRVSKDGTLIDVSINVSPIRDIECRVIGALAIAYDITEQKRMIEELATRSRELESSNKELAIRSRELEGMRSRLRAIIDASHEAMLFLTPDGYPIEVNSCFTNFFGLDATTVLAQSPDQLTALLKELFEASGSLDPSLIWSTADQEYIFREQLVQAEPSRREFDFSSLPVRNVDQTFIGRLYVWHDVTHERAVDRMKSDFVSMVSHELRTPLTSIKGYVGLLLTDQTVGELTELQREFLEIAQNNSRRLVALINDLLDLSRMESGKIELQRKPLNINLLIHELMPSFQLRWEAKRQTFTLHLPEGDPIVLGDTERVTQILSNLLSNANKYTPDEGHIALSVETAGSIACVAITDSGIGLSTEEQALLFTRFYRARNAVTEAVSGTGLGLVITRSLVEMQGGEIQVSSVPGHGSTLRFTLPLAQAPGLPALPRETLLGKRILVVDDDGQGRLLGATDYLYKPIEALDLLQRITPVFAGRSQHLILLVAPDSENHELLACLSILKETKARVYSMAQKQASQHVPNSNERKGIDAAIIQLASIVESSGDAIFGETLQGVITSWNNGAEKLFGYAADEVIGTSVSLIIPPDRQKELPEILARITAGETVQRYETTRMRKDGTHIEVSLTVSPIRDPKGRIMGASTITHDITEQKRMVEELIALNSALEEANRARSQFLSTMSHELRTPLASIIGFSQMLLDDADIANLNQQQHNDLERILKNGQHLLSLINDVLDLTKIEAGRMVVNFSQVDVRDLLTSVVEETQSIAIAQQLVLRAEVDEGMDFLESNPLKLRQVLLNLVSNVLKFTEQGEVTVSARRVISPDQEVEHVAIAVKDSGIGIPADIRAHVFEAFYQADGTYTHKAGGTGLGLSIVSQLTRLLGGTIAVTSAPGQGSTFTVMLPLKAVHHYIEQDPPRLHLAQPLEAPAIPPLLAISRQP